MAWESQGKLHLKRDDHVSAPMLRCFPLDDQCQLVAPESFASPSRRDVRHSFAAQPACLAVVDASWSARCRMVDCSRLNWAARVPQPSTKSQGPAGHRCGGRLPIRLSPARGLVTPQNFLVLPSRRPFLPLHHRHRSPGLRRRATPSLLPSTPSVASPAAHHVGREAPSLPVPVRRRCVPADDVSAFVLVAKLVR